MSEQSLSLIVGGEEKAIGLTVGGQLFVFTPNQQHFLLALQKMKNVTAAALSVGKDESWGKNFLSSRKFKKYLNLKMKSFSDKNGLDVEWWYQFGKNLTLGYTESYRASCSYCKFEGELDVYEVEACRTDEMTLDVPCPGCFQKVDVKLNREQFNPTREQVEGWKAIGDRLIPKTERVTHSFENVEILFQNEQGER